MRRLREALGEAAAAPSVERVLDFGCGKGDRAVDLLAHGVTVDGIDISESYVAEAAASARASGFPEARFRFVAGDAHALPYADGAFDLVVGEGILHHLELDTALAEVHQVLRPGGRAVFFEPLAAWRQAWVRPQRRRLEFAEVVRELCDEVYPEATIIRIVCDNRAGVRPAHTHTPAAFYERYPTAEARRLAERVEFVYTPVHGSWLGGHLPCPRGRVRVLGHGEAVPGPPSSR